MIQYLKKFERQVHERTDVPALCDYGGSSYTFGEVAAAIEQYHLFFAAAGIRKGQKIALCARSNARWAIAFLAVNTYGAVIVPILSDFTPEGISHLTNHSESVLLITEPEIWKKMYPEATPLLKGVLSAKADSLLWGTERVKGAWSSRKKLFAELYPEGFDTANVEYDGDNAMDLAILNYTSGTSGDPKGVMLTYNAMSDIVEYCQQNISNEPDVLVSNLPLAHMYGLAMEFIYPCCTGYTIHFLAKMPSPSMLLEALQTVKPRLLITVPLVIEKIYNSLIAPQMRTNSAKALRNVPGLRLAFYNSLGKKVLSDMGGRIQHIIIGGAPLNFEVESDLHKLGLPCVVGYGMTEACPLICLEKPGNYVPGSCGKPIHKVRITSPDPERIPGEIQTKGPNLCIGYYKNPEADLAARTYDGWFRTGDLGIMDEDGNVFIRGRITALILSASGQNIYPEEVEQVVMRSHRVQECLVLSKNGKIVAMVYPRPEAAETLVSEEAHDAMTEEIRTLANANLPLFSQIASVEIVDSPFERTAKGSIKRHLYQ
jgi:long-chain acyl-CoA synthetase